MMYDTNIRMIKRFIVVFVSIVILIMFVGVWYAFFGPRQSGVLSPIVQVVERPLDKYTIDNLTVRQGKLSEIVLDEAVATESAYMVYTFHFTSDGKRVTGLAHLPAQTDGVFDSGNQRIKPDQDKRRQFAVIVQIRGYVDPSIYEPGVGTKRSAEVFARNGYISLAPDFLGYGGSDNPSDDVFEERFQTYTVLLDLLASIGTLEIADPTRVGLWAHSNGGQIALTALVITQKPYPTTLWAPVTRTFPYSILYYTDEAEDKGKALRKKLAEFERNYDVDLYTMVNFLDRITAPLYLHQGTSDNSVPVRWNEEFMTELEEKNKTIGYFLYPGADHNLQPSWNTVISRDLEFFQKYLHP